MDKNYSLKYNKYKAKYLKLKYNQRGGCINECNLILPHKIKKYTKIDYTGNFNIRESFNFQFNDNAPKNFHINNELYTIGEEFKTDEDKVILYKNDNNNAIIMKIGKYKGTKFTDVDRLREVKAAKCLDYFIKVYQFDNKYMFMEYADGTLADFKGKLNELQLLELFNCLICLILKLKENNIFYTDLKLENIFYNMLDDNKIQLLLGDYGGIAGGSGYVYHSYYPFFIKDTSYSYKENFDYILSYGIGVMYILLLLPELNEVSSKDYFVNSETLTHIIKYCDSEYENTNIMDFINIIIFNDIFLKNNTMCNIDPIKRYIDMRIKNIKNINNVTLKPISELRKNKEALKPYNKNPYIIGQKWDGNVQQNKINDKPLNYWQQSQSQPQQTHLWGNPNTNNLVQSQLQPRPQSQPQSQFQQTHSWGNQYTSNMDSLKNNLKDSHWNI